MGNQLESIISATAASGCTQNPEAAGRAQHPTAARHAQYLLIGSGRLAQHLQFYFNSLELPLLSWDRSQDPHLLKTHLESATHVLLAISDQALEGFYRLHLDGLQKTVIHFSGALSFPNIHGAHPLMSFGKDLYPVELYKKIHFVIEGSQKLADLLPGLQNPSSQISAEQKPYYHALCVLGGNFTTLLTQKMIGEFQDLGIPNEAGHIYLEQIIENVFANPQGALTGPLARKDVATVQKNLQSLSQDPYQKIYQAFLSVHWPDFNDVSKTTRSL